MIRSASIQLT